MAEQSQKIQSNQGQDDPFPPPARIQSTFTLLEMNLSQEVGNLRQELAVLASREDRFATKDDLVTHKNDFADAIKAEIATLKTELKADIASTKAELKDDLKEGIRSIESRVTWFTVVMLGLCGIIVTLMLYLNSNGDSNATHPAQVAASVLAETAVPAEVPAAPPVR
jgi:hypothetical protein